VYGIQVVRGLLAFSVKCLVPRVSGLGLVLIVGASV